MTADNDHAVTVQALIDRIEARAYDRGKADGMCAPICLPAQPVDAPPEHPILRKLRTISATYPAFDGWCLGTGDARFTWEDVHAYRREWEATHQGSVPVTLPNGVVFESGDCPCPPQRPQTGQGDVAGTGDAQRHGEGVN